MSDEKYHIPQLQPLPPSALFSRKKAVSDVFPFSNVNSQYYYLARNALWHGIPLLGLEPGDVVLMPAYHHGIEVETLLKRGLTLSYYRIDERMQIDFDHLESLVGPDTKALYVIHYLGFPQPNRQLLAFAGRHELKFIEDCALSLFSSSEDGPLGCLGDMSIFCLYKTLPVPHGGMLVLNVDPLSTPALPSRPNLFSTASYVSHRLLDNLGLVWEGRGCGLRENIKSAARILKRNIETEQVHIDSEQLDEKHLSLGVSGLTHYLLNRMDIERVIKHRRENYCYLANLLTGAVDIPFPNLPDKTCPLFFPVIVEDKLAVHQELNRRGVESVHFWSRTHADVNADEFPEVRYLRNHVLELPIHQGLRKRHIEYVASTLKEIL